MAIKDLELGGKTIGKWHYDCPTNTATVRLAAANSVQENRTRCRVSRIWR